MYTVALYQFVYLTAATILFKKGCSHVLCCMSLHVYVCS